MQLGEICKQLDLAVYTGRENLEREVTSGYASDLLSCAMARTRSGSLWVTLQGHVNIVAVASLTEAAGIILTEGIEPDSDTVAKAQEEGLPILVTDLTTFTVVGKLAQLGIPGVDEMDQVGT